jgi:hypothetical protein
VAHRGRRKADEALALVVRDLPAPQVQRSRIWRSVERRRFFCQGSGSMPSARRIIAGSRARARVGAGVSMRPTVRDGARGREGELGLATLAIQEGAAGPIFGPRLCFFGAARTSAPGFRADIFPLLSPRYRIIRLGGRCPRGVRTFAGITDRPEGNRIVG